MPVPVPAGKPFPRTREEREQYWDEFGRLNEHLGGNLQFMEPPEHKKQQEVAARRQLEKAFPPYGILLFLYGDAYRGKRGLFGPGKRALEAARTNESTYVDTGGHSWLTRPFKSRSSERTGHQTQRELPARQQRAITTEKERTR